MSTFAEVMGERRKKRDALLAFGMNPYTAVTNATHTNAEVLSQFLSLQTTNTSVTIAGRIMALRLHGGMAFADVFDGTKKLQLFFSKETLGEKLFDLFFNNIDIGDFIEASGVPFVTKRET
ncbi:lysine--tRNA ligase, partial [Candidatus Kaiserbacteria bacterium]|nr:lysine--tRNA ligase [Candidatus Kaiserbacteria bacterium]